MNFSLNLIKYLRYSSAIGPTTICTQILRHNCENKDKIELFVNAINLKSGRRETEEHFQYDGSEHYNESKLLQNIQNIDTTTASSRSNWLKIRNDCLNHLSVRGGSKRFSMEFVNILNAHDREFARDHQKLVHFLTRQLMDWRSKRQNLDALISSLCDLYRHYSMSKMRVMSQQISLTTKAILDDILRNHGSSAVVKISHSFKRVCEETRDYELLFILWKELFESEWYSDQQFAHQLIDMTEVRKILASKTRMLCVEYFNDNDTDLANKMIQIFLKYNMRANVELTLKFYLAYECFQANASAATQVVKLCIELNVPLSEAENRKYLDLLLKRPKQQQKRQESTPQDEESKEKISVEKYKFKF